MKFTTLIPAYKPKYLVELLTALRHQTVKPAKIIVSDDSSDRAFINALSAEPLRSTVADLHIEVVRGPCQGGLYNFRHLLKLYTQDPQRSELFHVLLDDDILYPRFYERHLEAHQIAQMPCVVSRRWSAQENGQPTRDNLPVPSAIGNHPQRMLALGPEILFPHLVGTSSNWLGEFSNVTFRTGMAPELDDNSLGGISFAGLEDLGAFLKVSLHGSIGYLNEYLGYFRQSANQNSANPMGRPLKLAFLAYVALAIASRKLQRLTLEQSQAAIQKASSFVLFHYGGESDMRDMCALLPALIGSEPGAEQAFLVAWEQFSQGGSEQHTPSTPEAEPKSP
jgi:hypothetical protein